MTEFFALRAIYFLLLLRKIKCNFQGWQRVLHVLHCTGSIFKMYYMIKVYYIVLPVYSMCTTCTTFLVFFGHFLLIFKAFSYVITDFFCASRNILLDILKRYLMSFDWYCHVFKLDETIKKYCNLVISTEIHLTLNLLRL